MQSEKQEWNKWTKTRIGREKKNKHYIGLETKLIAIGEKNGKYE